MKLIRIILFLFFMSCSTNQKVERKIAIELIGWEFSLSNDIKFIDSCFNTNGELIKDVPKNGNSLRMFTIKDSSVLFNAYVRSDTLEPIRWQNYHDKDYERNLETLEQIPDMSILESKNYNKTIDSINFIVQYVKYINKEKEDTVFNYHHYGKLNEFELDIGIECNNQLILEKYLRIFNNSKFKD